MWRYCWGFLLILVACEGPVGPEGPQGPHGRQGEDGSTLWVQVDTGTILNRNYTDGNPDFASIPVGELPGLFERSIEPTVLFLGIENDNGVYNRIDFSSVIWGGSGSDYSVPGTSGWYVLVYDRSKDLVGSNYQVKFVQ